MIAARKLYPLPCADFHKIATYLRGRLTTHAVGQITIEAPAMDKRRRSRFAGKAQCCII